MQRLRGAERNEQKSIRAGLRRRGFHISDWRADGEAFTRTDFDVLVRDGLIKITNGEDASPSDHVRSAETPVAHDRMDQGTGGDEPVVPAVVGQAIAALSDRRFSLSDAETELPNAPGLYAIHGDFGVWEQLGLGEPPDSRSLYVGKAEDSLVRRDLRTHFRSGKTGSSTLRRSIAGLLAAKLDLHARPRNPAKPERFANYGLEKSSDDRLTDWMSEHLRIAGWAKTVGVGLRSVEIEVLARLRPPLNLKDITTPWSSQVSRARKALASDVEQRSPH